MTTITKRLRFEIFRRDNHACRYCGATAPDATLTIDHVVPVALGGSDDPGNLVTACKDCNAGKSSSVPDQPVVADVSADALRWAQAAKEASWILLGQRDFRAQLYERFRADWDVWTWDFGKQPFPLPDSWRTSVGAILDTGFPLELLTDCIEVAMAASHVQAGNRFRYMCGVAWRRVREMQEIAQALLEESESSEPKGRHHRAPQDMD